MRTVRGPALLILIGVLLGAPGAGAQTRAEEDAGNPLRQCGLVRGDVPPDSFAVRCAEWFVARQGYTDDSVRDTTAVVSEGIEWANGKRQWLRHRHNSLERRAVGLCFDQERGYDVAFLVRGDSTSARGVTLTRTFGSLRMQHTGFNLGVLRDRPANCRPLAARKP